MAKNNVIGEFKTSNKLNSLLKEQLQKSTPRYEKNGVYKTNCNNCPKYYIGQTSRSFKKRFREHVPKITVSLQSSNFAEHLVSNNRNYTSIDNNMDILQFSQDITEIHWNNLKSIEQWGLIIKMVFWLSDVKRQTFIPVKCCLRYSNKGTGEGRWNECD